MGGSNHSSKRLIGSDLFFNDFKRYSSVFNKKMYYVAKVKYSIIQFETICD